MTGSQKLNTIRIVHTMIWLFFNVVIFYMLYCVVTGRITGWFWSGFLLLAAEGLALLLYGFNCPLTVLARKYSDSSRDNFDICLPNWLAKYTKLTYTLIVLVIVVLTIWRLV